MRVVSDRYDTSFDTSLTSLKEFAKCDLCTNMTNLKLSKCCYHLVIFDCGGGSGPHNLVLCGMCYANHLEKIKESQEKKWRDVTYYFYYGDESDDEE